jgi:hypothetical protein
MSSRILTVSLVTETQGSGSTHNLKLEFSFLFDVSLLLVNALLVRYKPISGSSDYVHDYSLFDGIFIDLLRFLDFIR